jgi:hypothetical protein
MGMQMRIGKKQDEPIKFFEITFFLSLVRVLWAVVSMPMPGKPRECLELL